MIIAFGVMRSTPPSWLFGCRRDRAHDQNHGLWAERNPPARIKQPV